MADVADVADAVPAKEALHAVDEGWRQATFLAVLMMLGFFAIVYVKKISRQQVGFSYDKIVSKKQYWRVLTSVLCHEEFGHVFLNVWLLWNCGGNMEAKRGSAFFMKYSIFLVLLSKVLKAVISHHLIHRWQMPLHSQIYYVGCSELALGWIMVASLQSDQGYLAIPNPVVALKVPMHLAPYMFIFASSLASSSNTTASSAAGLWSGMLVGFGFFDWLLESYWFMCMMVWVLGFLCSSLDDLARSPGDAARSLPYDEEAGGMPSSLPESELRAEGEMISASPLPSVPGDVVPPTSSHRDEDMV